MVETDAPFLYPGTFLSVIQGPLLRSKTKGNAPLIRSASSSGPHGKNMKRNEPSLLPYVVRKISECVSRSEADIAQETTQNAITFFDLH